MTNHHFCETCNKLRLTANGKIRPCLGQHGELDLRAALRLAASDDAVRELLLESLRRKPLEHDFCSEYQPSRPMTAIGG
jgi:cyclic pyranopterin phosphate synthase